ncbi:hypothetical protein BD626DRAFT_494032 [Schizophyllum amplum]|uniref:Uncharacterized protein n=1 Tax=Schizophyllum amplum TaxID=97359 RepID=A0A550CHB0_9AGAR|nr:hypothetical protein BD626DRAFT_494032 [Auriculariopsis ampla]
MVTHAHVVELSSTCRWYARLTCKVCRRESPWCSSGNLQRNVELGSCYLLTAVHEI